MLGGGTGGLLKDADVDAQLWARIKPRCKLNAAGSIAFQKTDNLQESCLYALAVLRECQDGNGVLLSQVFEKVPALQEVPAYHQQIANPIDLQQIDSKVFSNAYSDLFAFEQALVRMFSNARTFYSKGTEAHTAADILERFVSRELNRIHTRGITAFGPEPGQEPKPDPPAAASPGMDTAADASSQATVPHKASTSAMELTYPAKYGGERSAVQHFCQHLFNFVEERAAADAEVCLLAAPDMFFAGVGRARHPARSTCQSPWAATLKTVYCIPSFKV